MKHYATFISLAFLTYSTLYLQAHAEPYKTKQAKSKPTQIKSSQIKPAQVKWKSLAKDIEYAVYKPHVDTIFSQELLFIRTGLTDLKPTVLFDNNKFYTAKQFCINSGSSICINANFFDENNKALGLVKRDGAILNPLHKGGSVLNGILSIENNKIKITPRKFFNTDEAQSAVQSGPLLIKNGQIFSTFKKADVESRRAGACIDSNGKFILFCSLGDVTGPSFNDLVSILLMPGIKCRDAINFDGGGSAQFFINEKFVNIKNNQQDNKEDISQYNITEIGGKYSIPVALSLINKK